VEQRRDFKFGTQVGRRQETLNETHLHTDCHICQHTDYKFGEPHPYLRNGWS